MILKNYQKTAVDKLVQLSRILLSKHGSRVCVLKAPTGSGKTIVIADYLQQLATEHLPNNYAYIWISGNNLHKQSREKLERYLSASRYTFSYIEDIQGKEFSENEVTFVNWHSLTKQDKKTGAYTNVFMRDNEDDKNLRTYIENSKEKGLQIILIVDESHYHYWSDKSQQLVQEVINPKLTIEVSATPKLQPSAEDISNGDAGYVSVKFEDVVAEGMIKTEIVINREIGKYRDFAQAADEAILSASLEKRDELLKMYESLGKSINPLVLIQLPNDGEATSVLDKTKLEFVEKFLKNNYQISRENGLLGVWLSSDTTIDKHQIVENESDVRVLVFKQAIALGWDCPRAQILVMFRDIKSITFEVQTVGRILRMPEATHYDNDELNRAFLYTNLPKVQVAKDNESQNYFQINPAHRIEDYKEIKLPSVYISRADYGDLTLKFRKLFIEEANKYFGILETDLPHAARDKADVKLDLLPDELEQPVISDAVFKGVDNVEDILGSVVHFSVPEDDLKYKFELFAKAGSLPYAPVRSHTKIQQSIYDWFDNYLGYKDASRIEVQRIVVCSEQNQKIFNEIITSAKERFKEEKTKEIQQKQSKKASIWEVPVIDYFNETYEKCSNDGYSMDACYLQYLRSQPEKDFEEALSKSKNIQWWYKNGVSKESYFAIAYKDGIDNVERAFYPDYIILFKDGTVGIFDTKSGFTAASSETCAKSDSLQSYLSVLREAGRSAIGGVVASRKSGMFLFTDKEYSPDANSAGWQRLDF